MRIFGEDGWTGRTTATLTDEFAEPLAVRGNIPVAVLSSIARLVITLPTKGRQLLRTDCDWNVSDARHFHRVEEGPFLYSTELRSVLTNHSGKSSANVPCREFVEDMSPVSVWLPAA